MTCRARELSPKILQWIVTLPRVITCLRSLQLPNLWPNCSLLAKASYKLMIKLNVNLIGL